MKYCEIAHISGAIICWPVRFSMEFISKLRSTKSLIVKLRLSIYDGKLPINTLNWSMITGIRKKNIRPMAPVNIIYVMATARPFLIFLFKRCIRGEIRYAMAIAISRGITAILMR
jgi:hypothetical protein